MDKVSSFLRRMQFYTFIKNIDKILASFNADEAPEPENLTLFAQEKKETKEENIQQNLFTQAIKETVSDNDVVYTVVNDENINDVINELNNSDRISYRIGLNDGKISGIAISNGKNYYFSNKYISNIKPLFENQNTVKIAFDAKSDYHTFLYNGINFTGLEYDVLLASYVKDPNRKHSIDAQSLDFLGHIIANSESKEEFLCDEAETIFKLHNYWLNNLDDNEQKLLYDV